MKISKEALKYIISEETKKLQRIHILEEQKKDINKEIRKLIKNTLKLSAKER